METTKTTLTAHVDMKVHVKMKLSALWASVMLCYIYGDYLTLFIPGFIEGVIAGKMPLGSTSQINLLALAIFISIPAAMIFMSLILKPKVNRWTNIILGIIYTVAVLVTFFMDPWAYYIFLGIVEVVLTALIIWYAWNWPKQESVQSVGNGG
jgi:hypothetical protein